MKAPVNHSYWFLIWTSQVQAVAMVKPLFITGKGTGNKNVMTGRGKNFKFQEADETELTTHSTTMALSAIDMSGHL